MHIGTVRPEEARIYDTFAGYHSFHAEESQDEYGSFEVFWADRGGLAYYCGQNAHEGEPESAAGWYWWACFPGALPDGEAAGPFASSRQALEDADEWGPEFDDDGS